MEQRSAQNAQSLVEKENKRDSVLTVAILTEMREL